MPPTQVQATPRPVAARRGADLPGGKRSILHGTRSKDRAGLKHSKEYRDLPRQKIHNISNEEVEVTLPSVAENFLTVDGSGIPGINKGDTLTSTEHRLRDACIETFLDKGLPNRSSDAVHNWEIAEEALSKRRAVPFGFGDQSNIGVRRPCGQRPLHSI